MQFDLKSKQSILVFHQPRNYYFANISISTEAQPQKAMLKRIKEPYKFWNT